MPSHKARSGILFSLLFVVSGLLLAWWPSGCNGKKQASSTETSGGSSQLQVPCTDEASCRTLYSGTACTPPPKGEDPGDGSSFSYDQMIDMGLTLETIECISAFTEEADIPTGCFTVEALRREIDAGDTCRIQENDSQGAVCRATLVEDCHTINDMATCSAAYMAYYDQQNGFSVANCDPRQDPAHCDFHNCIWEEAGFDFQGQTLHCSIVGNTIGDQPCH